MSKKHLSHFPFGMEAKNSNELINFGNQDIQRKENCERTRGKKKIWKSKIKPFLLSILKKQVMEINNPNFISLYL